MAEKQASHAKHFSPECSFNKFTYTLLNNLKYPLKEQPMPPMQQMKPTQPMQSTQPTQPKPLNLLLIKYPFNVVFLLL